MMGEVQLKGRRLFKTKEVNHDRTSNVSSQKKCHQKLESGTAILVCAYEDERNLGR